MYLFNILTKQKPWCMPSNWWGWFVELMFVLWNINPCYAEFSPLKHMLSGELLGWCPSLTALSAAQWLDCSCQRERMINFWSEDKRCDMKRKVTHRELDWQNRHLWVQRSNGLIGKCNSKIYQTEVAKVIDNKAPVLASPFAKAAAPKHLPLLVQGHAK